MTAQYTTPQELQQAATAGVVPESAALLAAQLEPLTAGLRQQIPVLAAGARLFRVRRMDGKPHSVSEVGAPPPGVAPIGRLNEAGESVLYLADSPDTAFAEAKVTSELCCLSEWRIRPAKVALANGGIPLDQLRRHFPNDFDPHQAVLGGTEDHEVLALLRTLFTLPVGSAPSAYLWSIASGFASGFAAVCGRTVTKTIDGNTMLSGRYPLSGIAYASLRKDRQAINFAFNDLGITYLELNHVQWVERGADGRFAGVDFAGTWDQEGNLTWQGRAARYQLPPGAAARLVKISNAVWHYEQLDGTLPEFS